jgi:hypothetical protein
MSEIDEPNDGKDNRQTKGKHRVDAPEAQGIDELLYKLIHRSGSQIC